MYETEFLASQARAKALEEKGQRHEVTARRLGRAWKIFTGMITVCFVGYLIFPVPAWLVPGIIFLFLSPATVFLDYALRYAFKRERKRLEEEISGQILQILDQRLTAPTVPVVHVRVIHVQDDEGFARFVAHLQARAAHSAHVVIDLPPQNDEEEDD